MSAYPGTAMMVSLGLLFVASCGSAASTPAVTPSAAGEIRVTAPPSEPSPSEPPATPVPNGPSVDACQRDADCTLSTAPECGSCCQCGPLHALTVVAAQQRVDRCAATEFERPDCTREICVPCGSVPASTHAVCRSGACAVAP